MQVQKSINAYIKINYSSTDHAYYLQILTPSEDPGPCFRLTNAVAEDTTKKYEMKIENTDLSYQATDMPVQIDIGDKNRLSLLTAALEHTFSKLFVFPAEAHDIINSVIKPEEETPFADRLFAALKAGKTIPVHDSKNVDMKIGELSMASIITGEQLMANKYTGYFSYIFRNHNVNEAVSIWLQCACLKKVVSLG